jgi:hypothetical protein
MLIFNIICGNGFVGINYQFPGYFLYLSLYTLYDANPNSTLRTALAESTEARPDYNHPDLGAGK